MQLRMFTSSQCYTKYPDRSLKTKTRFIPHIKEAISVWSLQDTKKINVQRPETLCRQLSSHTVVNIFTAFKTWDICSYKKSIEVLRGVFKDNQREQIMLWVWLFLALNTAEIETALLPDSLFSAVWPLWWQKNAGDELLRNPVDFFRTFRVMRRLASLKTRWFRLFGSFVTWIDQQAELHFCFGSFSASRPTLALLATGEQF